jgi:hypothetical protein
MISLISLASGFSAIFILNFSNVPCLNCLVSVLKTSLLAVFKTSVFFSTDFPFESGPSM